MSVHFVICALCGQGTPASRASLAPKYIFTIIMLTARDAVRVRAETERLGHRPGLCHPPEPKRRMGGDKKRTDQLDSPEGWQFWHATSPCQHCGVQPSELSEQRKLRRLRTFLVSMQVTRNHAALARFPLQGTGANPYDKGNSARLRIFRISLRSRVRRCGSVQSPPNLIHG